MQTTYFKEPYEGSFLMQKNSYLTVKEEKMSTNNKKCHVKVVGRFELYLSET